METLRTKYARQLGEYDELLARGDDVSKLSRIRELNVALGKTIDEMITELTFLKEETPSIERERNDLMTQLNRIQRQYNDLADARDEYETLRRIRMEESAEANTMLYTYLLVFFVACLGLMGLVVFMSQRKDTTAPIARMPPTTAAFV